MASGATASARSRGVAVFGARAAHARVAGGRGPRGGRPRGGQARGRATGGQSLVEFALVLPVMMLILLIAVDFGRLFFSYVEVVNAAREAANNAASQARYVQNGTLTASDYYLGVVNAATQETNAQSQRGATAPLAVSSPSCFDPASHAIDCGSAAQDSTTATGIGNRVTVSVTQPFSFFTPFVNGFFGGALNLSSSASAPVLNPLVAKISSQPTPSPTPPPGSLMITKVLAGDLTNFGGGDFTFTVVCNGKSYGPVTITLASGSGSATVSGITPNLVCTVHESSKPNAGAHASWDTPADAQATITSGAQADVTITNTRTYSAPGPTPSPTATPTPSPTPTPTPVPMCTVPDFYHTYWADPGSQQTWANNGFTGTLADTGDKTKQIQSQSLKPGTSAACTSGMSVSNDPKAYPY